jgi:uroporphyrinogen-III decarboxylase
MTPDERLWSALRLEKPDRTPVIPTLLPEPAAGLAGVPQAQVASDNRAAVRAVFEVFDRVGGWDNPYPASYKPIQLQASGVFPMKIRIPGVDLDDRTPFQLEEREVLEPEDFEKIAEMGFDVFYEEDFLWRVSDLTPETRAEEMQQLITGGGMFLAECAKRERKPFFLANGLHPFFILSLMRSMVPFTHDVYFKPEPVERALRRMTTDLIEKQLRVVKQTGINIFMCSEERAGAFFFPPALFERFWWPYTREIVEALWSEGIVTLFHLDTCWDENIPYFKQLPRGSAVLELDSTTDIFAAKEALRGHICLKGDVSASLLSIGTADDVAAYCRRLIDEVGGDGGFILGSGCSVPPNAKLESFRAMIETGRRYELSRDRPPGSG